MVQILDCAWRGSGPERASGEQRQEGGAMPLREGGYGQYCPISRAVEVLGERWTMLIVRDLLVGSTRFNELARGNPRISRTLLSKRLQQLELAGIVERVDGEYHLTRRAGTCTRSCSGSASGARSGSSATPTRTSSSPRC